MTVHTVTLPPPLAELARTASVVLVPMEPQPEPAQEGWYFDAYAGGPYWNYWTKDNKCVLPQYLCPYAPGDTLRIECAICKGQGDGADEKGPWICASCTNSSGYVKFGPVASVEAVDSTPIRFLSDPESFAISKALDDAELDGWFWLIRKEGSR